MRPLRIAANGLVACGATLLLAASAAAAERPAGQGQARRFNRARLEHRIALMDKNADPDLVEELARTQLMDGAPNQVAVPRH